MGRILSGSQRQYGLVPPNLQIIHLERKPVRLNNVVGDDVTSINLLKAAVTVAGIVFSCPDAGFRSVGNIWNIPVFDKRYSLFLVPTDSHFTYKGISSPSGSRRYLLIDTINVFLSLMTNKSLSIHCCSKYSLYCIIRSFQQRPPWTMARCNIASSRCHARHCHYLHPVWMADCVENSWSVLTLYTVVGDNSPDSFSMVWGGRP